MFEENDKYFEEKNRKEIVNRYETLLNNKKPFYFDVTDFESIIEFYVEQNKISNAFEASSIASGIFPSSPEIKIKKAQLLLDKGKYVEALSELKTAIFHDPKNFEIFLLLGITYLNLNNYKESIRQFEECIKILPHEVKKDEIFLTIGFHLAHANKFTSAIKYLSKSIEINNNNIDAITEIAYCYDCLTNYNKCIEYYLKAIDIEPLSEVNWYNIGLVYIKTKSYKKAIEALDYSLAIDPSYLSAILAKAHILFYLEKYNEAVEVYKEYLIYDSGYADVYYLIGECYEKIDDVKNAIKYYDLTILKDKEHADAWLGLGILKMQSEDFASSLVCLSKSALIDKENPEAHYALSELFFKTNILDDALNHADIAVKISPEETDYVLLQSEIYEELKNDKKAISVLEEGLFSVLEKAPILYRLAGLYFLNRKEKKATEFLKNAINEDSSLISDFFNIFPQAKDCEMFKGLLNLLSKNKKNEL
ncbi:MAG: hypothetical protein COS14_06325 [Bacteroidetes bacterium CG02_land_8_20_14_3_00_31_25]|nr:MAG: hypothetical protein COS14_06325 [Bacteroidetes bacterium CG02_land_8_20_14_3_00_31_25]PIY02286.1 MAG: hypothetical protein COZ21_14960 [Bacteroidetes bacterium CG_4_10_14_3_um_filter_31_20]